MRNEITKIFSVVGVFFLVTALWVFYAGAQKPVPDDDTISQGYDAIRKAKESKKQENVDDAEVESQEEASDSDRLSPDDFLSRETPLYSPSGKRDPFKPFIQTTEVRETKTVMEDVPPIKKYPLEEFRLSGIVWTGDEPKAMVIDPEGNTYFLKVGDEIGSSEGEILEIQENRILVQEKKRFEDVFGAKKVEVKNSILAFREEG